MKKVFSLLCLLYLSSAQAQCGISDVCNGNTGLFSNNDATSIAYDNMGSGFHSTYIKETNSVWKVWGEKMGNNGTTNILSPNIINATNYPALTGTIYKMAIGSNQIDNVQLIVLTSTGLFVLGTEGIVFDNLITTSTTFQKITVNGKIDGLPLGVSPADVKMLFVTYRTITITTCTGSVYVLSQDANVRGNGGVGSPTQWAQVMENNTTPLSNVIVARGNYNNAFALKADGTIWTWGVGTYLGDGTALATRNYATQMTLPTGLLGVKMIQGTPGFSYYILGTDRKIYALGNNTYGQLGDRTSTTRTAWVNALNPDSSIINDAAWISTNEHDYNFAGIAVIKTGGLLYTAGNNSVYMIGRTITLGVNYLSLPTGVISTDVITYTETGGHTCVLIKQGSPRYGYVGHWINGSIGDGTTTSSVITSYDFIRPPIVNVCGTTCLAPTVTSNSPICPNDAAIFTIQGLSGDIVSYTINGGAVQTITIGASNTAVVTISNATINQQINLTQLTNASGTCLLTLTATATVTITGTTPTFAQVPAICAGGAIAALLTVSTNGINGSWSPAINNTATTTYTFTPNAGQCAATTTMTIAVNSPNTIPTFTHVATICSGSILAALPTTSNNNIVGTWSPALVNTATTLYTFTPNSGQCAVNTTMTITVTPKVTPTFTQIAAVCSGTTITPLPTTSNNGITGTWSPTLNNTVTTPYTFTPTAGLCANTASMTITITPRTLPTFTQVPTVCSGSTMTALPTTSNNGITGTWLPSLNNLSTTLYSFTPTTGLCASTATMTITVTPPNTVPTFTQVSAVCTGSTIAPLPTTSNNGITGVWSPALNNLATTPYTFTPIAGQCAVNTNMTITVNQKVNPTFTQVTAVCTGSTIAPLPTTSNNGITGTWLPALNNLATTTYNFTPTAGLCANAAPMTITVNQKVNPTFTQVSAICEGTTIAPLPTTSNNGITGTWSPALNNLATTTYNFTPTTGLCANAVPMTITVNQKVNPTFTQVSAICEGTTIAALPTTSNNGITGTWSPTLNNLTTTLYTFTPTTGLCANTAQMTITVNQKVTPTFNSFSTICYGAVAPALPSTSTNGYSGTWSPAIINNTQSGNYQFTPNPNQCTNQPPPELFTVYNDFNFELIHKCIGNNFTLQIAPIGNSFDLNTANFSWTDSNNLMVGANNNVFDVTNHLTTNNVTPFFPLNYHATVLLPNGCSKKVSTDLFSTFCEIQKGISPNNDRDNEFFDLRLLNVKELKIFNRYGLNVYKLTNYTNQWVGQNDAGQELPDGTYYYVIEFNVDKPAVVGWIYINREIK